MEKIPDHLYFRVKVGLTEVKLEDASDVDVVEVVRCKDCIHWLEYDSSPPDCGMNMLRMGPDDYCSYGERKNNETTDL
jgi:hypothetical protein